MRSYLILSMCFLFLAQYFLKLAWLETIVIINVLLAFTVNIMKTVGFPRIISLFMIITGISLEVHKGAGFAGISQGVMLILPLLCLVTLAPLLSLPLKVNGYFEAVNSLLIKLLKHPRKLFVGITSALFILSPILSLGSVRIIHDFLSDLKLPLSLSTKGYLIGFSTAIMWSPYFGSVSLVLYYLQMPVGDYILYGLGLSLVSLVVGNILFAFTVYRSKQKKAETLTIVLDKQQRKQLLQLIMFIFILLTASIILENITKWSMIVIVSLVSIFIPVIWAISKKNWKKFLHEWRLFKNVTILAMNNEMMLFTNAGIFGHGVQGTRVANELTSLLSLVAQKSFLFFALVVLAIVIIFTFIGLHQIAVIATLAMQLDPQVLGASPVSIAMLLLLSWAVSSVLSPFSGLNLMVSRFVGWSGVRVGLLENGLHLSLFTFIGLFIIMFVK